MQNAEECTQVRRTGEEEKCGQIDRRCDRHEGEGREERDRERAGNLKGLGEKVKRQSGGHTGRKGRPGGGHYVRVHACARVTGRFLHILVGLSSLL